MRRRIKRKKKFVINKDPNAFHMEVINEER